MNRIRAAIRIAALLPALLAGCGPRDGSDLPPADAARWMAAACSVRFHEPPRVLRSSVARTRAANGEPTSVIVTVVLPEAEAQAAIAALAHDRSLHRRGQSDTRYSYESYPEARPAKACELDTGQHVLYFQYIP
jgi:hypothetical protein